MAHRAHSKLSLFDEMDLILPNLVEPKLIGRAIEVPGEIAIPLPNRIPPRSPRVASAVPAASFKRRSVYHRHRVDRRPLGESPNFED